MQTLMIECNRWRVTTDKRASWILRAARQDVPPLQQRYSIMHVMHSEEGGEVLTVGVDAGSVYFMEL